MAILPLTLKRWPSLCRSQVPREKKSACHPQRIKRSAVPSRDAIMACLGAIIFKKEGRKTAPILFPSRHHAYDAYDSGGCRQPRADVCAAQRIQAYGAHAASKGGRIRPIAPANTRRWRRQQGNRPPYWFWAINALTCRHMHPLCAIVPQTRGASAVNKGKLSAILFLGSGCPYWHVCQYPLLNMERQHLLIYQQMFTYAV